MLTIHLILKITSPPPFELAPILKIISPSPSLRTFPMLGGVAARGCDSCDPYLTPTLGRVATRGCDICNTVFVPAPWAVSQQQATTFTTPCMSPHPGPCRTKTTPCMSPHPRTVSQQDDPVYVPSPWGRVATRRHRVCPPNLAVS